MSNATSARTGVTVRLAPDDHDRLRRIAEAQPLSGASYLELPIRREFGARDDSEQAVHIHVAPELAH